MSVEAIEPLAIVTDYLGLVTALRRRIVELGTGMESVDAVAGLPARYTSKLLSRNYKTSLGQTSTGPILGALGLKLAVLPDDEALAKIRHRLPARDAYGRGPQLQAAPGASRRKRAARELAAALMKLQQGRRGLRRPGAAPSAACGTAEGILCTKSQTHVPPL
jgi:hypothetical protein